MIFSAGDDTVDRKAPKKYGFVRIAFAQAIAPDGQIKESLSSPPRKNIPVHF
jgi:hypothetical protein